MKTTNNEVQKPDDATLVLKRVLNAPPERVFKASTAPEWSGAVDSLAAFVEKE